MRAGRDGFVNGKLAQFLFECPNIQVFQQSHQRNMPCDYPSRAHSASSIFTAFCVNFAAQSRPCFNDMDMNIFYS